MKFKELKVGDTLYIKNPKEWYKPIKKTIESIETEGADLHFYDVENKWIGHGRKNYSSESGLYFVNFDAFKKFSINYQKNYIKSLNYEMESVKEQLRLANDNLEIANELQDED